MHPCNAAVLTPTRVWNVHVMRKIGYEIAVVQFKINLSGMSPGSTAENIHCFRIKLSQNDVENKKLILWLTINGA